MTEVLDDPKDICCICGAEQDANTMIDVNEDDFELLCKDCEKCRCSNCSELETGIAFGEPVYSCVHEEHIENPNCKVCDYWDE